DRPARVLTRPRRHSRPGTAHEITSSVPVEFELFCALVDHDFDFRVLLAVLIEKGCYVSRHRQFLAHDSRLLLRLGGRPRLHHFDPNLVFADNGTVMFAVVVQLESALLIRRSPTRPSIIGHEVDARIRHRLPFVGQGAGHWHNCGTAAATAAGKDQEKKGSSPDEIRFAERQHGSTCIKKRAAGLIPAVSAVTAGISTRWLEGDSAAMGQGTSEVPIASPPLRVPN